MRSILRLESSGNHFLFSLARANVFTQNIRARENIEKELVQKKRKKKKKRRENEKGEEKAGFAARNKRGNWGGEAEEEEEKAEEEKVEEEEEEGTVKLGWVMVWVKGQGSVGPSMVEILKTA